MWRSGRSTLWLQVIDQGSATQVAPLYVHRIKPEASQSLIIVMCMFMIQKKMLYLQKTKRDHRMRPTDRMTVANGRRGKIERRFLRASGLAHNSDCAEASELDPNRAWYAA